MFLGVPTRVRSYFGNSDFGSKMFKCRKICSDSDQMS